MSEPLVDVHQKLARLVQPGPPYADLPSAVRQARDVSWVKPVLVAEIEVSNWTDDGLLRHPSFQGLREDKPASKVIHDEPISLAAAKALERPRHGAAAAAPKRPARTIAARRGGRTIAKAPADLATNDEWAGVHLTHPDKVLYPDRGLTKRDLARTTTPRLPAGCCRTSSIGRWRWWRCPAGSGQACFFQKHATNGANGRLREVNIAENGPAECHVAIDDVGGLISLVQMGVLEIHVWGSRTRRLEKPDRLIFDLDPDPAVAWPQVVDGAQAVRVLLEELGLVSFLKTTGGKGLHLVVPVRPRAGWVEAKAFCRSVAEFLAQAAPDRFVSTMSKSAAKGKIFIDYLRNGQRCHGRRPVFHASPSRRDRERPDHLGRARLWITIGSVHDRKPARPVAKAQERPVVRHGDDQTVDHRRDDEASGEPDEVIAGKHTVSPDCRRDGTSEWVAAVAR